MLGRAKRVFFGIAVVAVLTIVSGIFYEQWSRHDVVNKYPPPGRMIDVGGHKLHLNCTGSGSPTVVMESGWNTTGSLSFVRVQPEIAKSQRICSYDRAGIMWSERRDGTPSAAQIAGDLHRLLENASEAAPYVMVGYSMGGLLIRVFSQQYPQDVAGMVFVEPSHPEAEERFASIEGYEPYEYPRWTYLKQRVLIETGVARLFGILDIPSLPSEAMIANDFAPYGFVAYVAHDLAWAQISTEAAAASSFNDMPIIVLTGGLQIAPPTPEEAADMSPEEVRILNEEGRLYHQLHAEIAGLSTNSEHRVIEGSGHSMSNDAPEAVVRGVQDIIVKCCGDE
jgi:pimeloyl-ACP methyl ester carboxylesterase